MGAQHVEHNKFVPRHINLKENLTSVVFFRSNSQFHRLTSFIVRLKGTDHNSFICAQCVQVPTILFDFSKIYVASNKSIRRNILMSFFTV